MRLVIAALTALISLASASAAEQWQTFRDPAGAFSVEFPGAPSVKTSFGSNKDGHVVPPSVRYMAVDGAVALVVTDTDMTASTLQPEFAIEGAAQGLTAGGTVLSDTNITLNGREGRSVDVAAETGKTAARIFCFNSHLYQAIIMAPKTPSADEQAAIDRFAHSLKILTP